MDTPTASSPLFAGMFSIIERSLGIASTRHWSALCDLQKHPPSTEQFTTLIDEMFAQMVFNWNTGRTNTDRNASRQNWRLVLIDAIGDANKSPEVALERAIARACKSAAFRLGKSGTGRVWRRQCQPSPTQRNRSCPSQGRRLNRIRGVEG
jgi:hypothetical protein